MDLRRGDPTGTGSGVDASAHPRWCPDEELSPLQRLLTCVDSASGVSAALDVTEWNFMNTELTVHVVRPPVGEWVCLHADTTLGPGSVGVAASEVYDERGLIARSAQALLVTPGRPASAGTALRTCRRSTGRRGRRTHAPVMTITSRAFLALPHRCNAREVTVSPRDRGKPSTLQTQAQSWIRANGWASSSS